MVGKVHWHKEQALTNKFSALNISRFSSEIEKEDELIQEIR